MSTADDPIAFSVVPDHFVDKIRRAFHLAKKPISARITFLIGLCWGPPLVLSIIDGKIPLGEKGSFLLDISIAVRFFIALPLLIKADEWVGSNIVRNSTRLSSFRMKDGDHESFRALHRRTGEARWLARARAFAMHGIAQTDAAARRHGQLRYSLWTGDPGFAVYLWDCLRGEGAFPTLDAFFA